MNTMIAKYVAKHGRHRLRAIGGPRLQTDLDCAEVSRIFSTRIQPAYLGLTGVSPQPRSRKQTLQTRKDTGHCEPGQGPCGHAHAVL